MSVGGYTDTPLDLVATGNTDEKHRNGLPQVRVDDALFRKSLVTTSHMGQTTVCMDKGTALGKRDTTLSHHDTFTRKIIGIWIRVSRRISGQ
jgi:hypothetical protein